MQKSVLIKQISEEIEALEKSIEIFKRQNHFTSLEANQALGEVEKLYRALAAYAHIVKHNEISSDLNVHVKIMQAIEAKEEIKVQIENKITESGQLDLEITKEETEAVEESQPEKVKEPSKKVEVAVNDKYRFINELFEQNQAEFNAALQQINASDNIEDINRYLASLKQLYDWKDNSPLVKTFFSLAQKRFN